MGEPCPVCGADLADDTEAWLHLREAHAGSPDGPRPARPSPSSPNPSSPSGPGSRAPRPTSRPDVPAGAGGVWRQGWRNGPATMVVIAITVGAYALHRLLQVTAHVNTDHKLAGIGTLGGHGEWWRLVTPLVVHFGVVHLLVNMAWVYQLGPAIERVMGKVGFVATYLASGIAGNVTSDLVYYNHQNVLAGGASGSVYGLGGVLVGAWAVASWIDRRYGGPRRPGSVILNTEVVRSLAIFFGAYIVVTLTILKGVDTAAHAGGGVMGLIIGAGLAWTRNRPVSAAPSS